MNIQLTSVLANTYPTTEGTNTAYMNEIHAVRGVHRKYLYRSLLSSVSTVRIPYLRRSTAAAGKGSLDCASSEGAARRTVIFLVGRIEAQCWESSCQLIYPWMTVVELCIRVGPAMTVTPLVAVVDVLVSSTVPATESMTLGLRSKLNVRRKYCLAWLCSHPASSHT